MRSDLFNFGSQTLNSLSDAFSNVNELKTFQQCNRHDLQTSSILENELVNKFMLDLQQKIKNRIDLFD